MPAVDRRSNLLLQALSEADFEALQPHLEVVKLAKHAILIEAGSPASHIYLPHAGAVSIVVSLSDGQAVQVAIVGRDSIVGASAAFGDGIALTDAVVLFPGSATMIDVTAFRTVADRSRDFRQLLARHAQALHAQEQQSAACNAAHSVEARLSRWLLRARDLYDGETLPLTQEFMAGMIGVQRNAISIVAHALQRAGIISYSRGRIEIRDLAALRATACECYHAVKVKHEHLLKARYCTDESAR
jgi:CRP-like cAMP-binding protein